MPLDIDRFAHLESSIQRWDPRIKIFSLGLFVFSVAIIQTLPIALLALGVALYFLRLSGLPLDFVSHSMKFIIFFLLPFFIIMPLSYPSSSDMHYHLWGLTLAIEGLRLATLIFIKAVAIVLTTFAMFGSSRFDVSMIALQHLRVPKMLIQMLLFSYRYTFVFMEEMRRMQIAMRVRGFVLRSDMKTLKTIGNFVGTLLVRSFERSERVYKAMLSKGYQGELHSTVTFSADNSDYVKCALVLVTAVAILTLDFSGLFTAASVGWY